MSLKSIILFAGAAMGHTVFSRDTKFGCGAPEPTNELIEVSRKFGLLEAANREMGILSNRAMHVNVYLHSVATSEGSVLSVRPRMLSNPSSC